MKLIARAWESYRRAILPSDAGAVQVKETRQAFFAGAAILQTLVMTKVSAGDEITAEDMAMMAALQEELDAFGREIDAAVLGISTAPTHGRA